MKSSKKIHFERKICKNNRYYLLILLGISVLVEKLLIFYGVLICKGKIVI